MPDADGELPGLLVERLGLATGREFDLIRELVAAANAPARISVPVGDDAALLEWSGPGRLVISTDLAVEEVHFRRAWTTWEVVGYRAAAAALSDLAAMAARPLGVLASLALPPELGEEIAGAVGAGMGECLRGCDAGLLGGDLTRSPGPVFLDVVAVGTAERAIRRSDARPGDEVWVTGELGGAASAVADFTRSLEPDPRARRAYERPVPRIPEALWLVERFEVGAMIDLSDGLAGDAAHIAAASRVAVELEMEAIPLAGPLQGYANQEVALRLAVGGGEDFELLFTARAGAVERERAEFESRFGISLTRLGRVTEGRGLHWLAANGTEVPFGDRGYDHFAAEDHDP